MTNDPGIKDNKPGEAKKSAAKTMEENKKKAFERGLHDDNIDEQDENITNTDTTIVNTQEEDKVVNAPENHV